MPLLSLIIPCYNASTFLDELLASIWAQDYPAVEVIAVDDGSQDDTLARLRAWQARAPRPMQVLTGPNQGASAARNRGLHAAQGDLVQFMDADDLLLPGKLSRQVAALAHSGADWVASDYEVRDTSLAQLLDLVALPRLVDQPLETAITRIIITGNPLYRREAVLAIGGYDEALPSSQDWDFHLRLVLADRPVHYVSGPGFVHRIVAGSISHNWVKTSRTACQVVDKLKSQLALHPGLTQAARLHLANLFYNTAIQTFDAAQISHYLSQCRYWSQGQPFFSSPIKRRLHRLLGLTTVLRLDQRRLRFA